MGYTAAAPEKPMNFDLHIQNIGKLTDAKIRIGRFTVFAGPNNTGKSFVSKILYSILGAMKLDHIGKNVWGLMDSLRQNLKRLEGYSEEMDSLLSPINEKMSIQNMVWVTYLLAIPRNRYTLPAKMAGEFAAHIRNVQNKFQDARLLVERMESENSELFPFSFSESADEIEAILRKLEAEFGDENEDKILSYGAASKIKDNLIGNFQVENLSDLMAEKGMVSKVSSDHVGELKFSSEEIDFQISQEQFSRLQKFVNVIYLESPIYWKMKNALESAFVYPGISPKHESSRKPINGIPKYFYDMADAMKFRYTGDIAFPEIHKRLTGEEVLGGKIAISENNDLSFQENGRSFSMPVTAMGVANLGILALLIERKVLDENSLIFIDEPEAHLHPAWQVVMAETLFELAKGGAHVVIATHSVDILKWLEVHIQKHPEDEKLVALNKFPVNGNETDNRDFDYKMAAIKGELTEPFADLYTAGL